MPTPGRSPQELAAIAAALGAAADRAKSGTQIVHTAGRSMSAIVDEVRAAMERHGIDPDAADPAHTH